MDKPPTFVREIAIRLEDGAPMRGSVDGGSDDGPVRFVGWLSLLAALERLCDERLLARPLAATTSRRRTK